MTTKTKKTEDGGVQVRRIRAGGFWCWLHRMETPGLACYNLANISSISHDIQSPQSLYWGIMGYHGVFWDIMGSIYHYLLGYNDRMGIRHTLPPKWFGFVLKYGTHTHTHTPIYGHQNTGKCMGWNGVPDLLNNLTWKLLIGNFQKYMYIYYIYVYVYRYVLTYHDRNRADEVCSDMNRP